MIFEQLVSFETAKLLKEDGFNYYCRNLYEYKYGYLTTDEADSDSDWNSKTPEYFSRPSQSHAASWIRENHNLHISIEPYANTWRWILWWTNGEFITNSATAEKKDFETYEQAMEDALMYVLNGLNTKNNEKTYRRTTE